MRGAGRLAVGGALVVAFSGLATQAQADCVRDGTVVTCATASPNGYEETVTDGRTDRTVNVSADVADGIDITLSAGGNIVIDQTAGTITNNYGDSVYLKTTDGKVSGTVGNLSTKDNALEIVASEIDVTVAGSVSGTGRFSSGVVFNDVGTVKITNAGGTDHAISGNSAGINVWHADSLTLINENGSKILGTGRSNSGVFANDVSGDVWISNDASSITGSTALGVWYSGGDVTVLNGSGTMSGSDYGIDIYSLAGNASVTNGSGLLAGGTYSGVSFVTIGGDVELHNGAGGRITSTSDYGVLAYLVEGDTRIENLGGFISSGGYGGIYADGASVTIVNGTGTDAEEIEQLGFITGGIVIDSGAYSAIDNTGGATLTNEAGGVIISQALDVLDQEITREQIAAASADRVVKATGGRIAIVNDGILIGRVELTKSDDTFENSRVWAVTGINDFGAGHDVLTNHGTLYAASFAETAETTRFDNLESFVNHRIFSLADGGAGDLASFSGDVSFETGATYLIDVDLAGHADLISAGGTATIDPGASIRLRAVDDIAFGTDYHVLTATGGVDGNFGNVDGETPVSAFVGLTSSNTGNDIFVRFDQARAFTQAASTRNQRATATALDTLPAKGPTRGLRNALLFLETDAQARGAFDQLAGEVHASSQSLFIQQSGLIRSALIDRMRAAQGAVAASAAPVLSYAPAQGTSAAGRAIDDGLVTKAAPAAATTPERALWATGFGSWTNIDGTANSTGLNGATGGFLMGGDGALDGGWRLGVAGGYSSTSFSGQGASGDSDNWHIGAYGGNQWGALALRAGLAYTWQDVSTSRSVAFPGFADSLSADYHAGLFQAFGELGYRLDTAFAAFEPFANLSYVSLDTDGYGEWGGAAALSSSGTDMETSFTTLGLRAEKEVLLGAFATTLRGAAGWRHAFGDITPVATQAFLGSAAFDTTGVAIAQDAAVLEVGLDVQVGAGATLGVAYTGQFGDGVSENGFNATFTLGF
ncbi:autotransporter domain-containing protein [Ancylobacter sp. FA202]|uniref:autotransporter outer membrane beta-barrel domain-containing protein n=1 Tax=Ancylobacter sp. FA202 TaxID=1111106 RepID=UPI00039AB737|nr:autotransporter domain-containing protein [Ancylobacter sp. FA202]